MHMRWPIPLIILFLMGTGLGCAHRQVLPIPTTPQVKQVKVDGAKQIPKRQARDALGTRQTPWWALGVGTRRFWVPLDRDLVLQDQERLVRFYEAMGFFEARCPSVFTEYAGKEVGEGRRWAIVTFTVDEGPRAVVRTVDLVGIDDLDPALRGQLAGAARLSSGDAFELPRHEDDRAALQRLLTENGHAHAQVERRADAYPEEGVVDLTYTVTPGPVCRYGKILLLGLRTVPRKRVEKEVRISEGERYSTAALRELQADLFGLGVFSVVTVTPDLKDPTDDVIGVQVSMRESRPISIKFGGGIGLERGRDDAHISFTLTHHNLFGKLVQLYSQNKFGWAVVPGITRPKSHGPIGQGELELLEPTPLIWLRLRQRVRFEADVESGYSYLSPQVSVGTDFRLHRRLSVGIGYNFELFWLYQQDPELFNEQLRRRVPEIDVDGLYTLSYLDQHLTWDVRNDPLFTTRGALVNFSVAEAGLGGSFEYLRFHVDLRGYIDPIPKMLIFALRLQGGLIHPLGDTESAPLSQRFKLGGSSSIRGWTRDLLGPRYYPLTCESGDPCGSDSCGRRECDPYPTGGHVMLAGGPEVRFFPLAIQSWRFGGAAFLDVGRVWSSPEQFSLQSLMWSVGGGLRVVSPVGTIRLDAAGRLNTASMFADDPMFLIHFGLSEAF
jgi:outer membrane protein assembly factor BamA